MSLRVLRLLTAGESHGPMLVGILDGLPAGIPVDSAAVDRDLERRMGGYGRGKRMKIERDRARFVAGIRHGVTLGGPVAWLIENRDWTNWRQVMAPEAPDEPLDPDDDPRRVSRPRPGHADLAGGLKYDRADLRDILERASARETAGRVAAGGVCKALLGPLEIEVASHVVRIGEAALETDRPVPFERIRSRADDSPVRCTDADAEAAMMRAIDAASDDLDTLGGAFEVVARGLPPGLGSHVQWNRKLDGRIAQALMSIPAQKAVEIGDAVWAAGQPGSAVHDPIAWDAEEGRFVRPTNRAGGTEGGVTYGEEVRVRVYMKPLSTLRKPLPSVDIRTREAAEAVVQRTDVCAVPAAAVIGEAMLALVLADACLEKFGGDSLDEVRRNRQGFLEQTRRFPPG